MRLCILTLRGFCHCHTGNPLSWTDFVGFVVVVCVDWVELVQSGGSGLLKSQLKNRVTGRMLGRKSVRRVFIFCLWVGKRGQTHMRLGTVRLS